MSQTESSGISIYAAGSLRFAVGEIVEAFRKGTGVDVETSFGPSHLLREKIEAEGGADVFASANMEHPYLLTKAERSGPTVVFARTRVCALVRSDDPVQSTDFLDYVLDPATKIGTGTPGGDPLGDYTWEVFERAERLRPGSFEALSGKAIQLFGGRRQSNLSIPEGKHPIIYMLGESRDIDIFFVYCANGGGVVAAGPTLRIMPLPLALNVDATFGLTVMSQASAAANRLALTILSREGQAILARHGFDAPLLGVDGASALPT